MTSTVPLPTSDDSPRALLLAMRQQQRLVVVVDLMESVRLMQQNEQATLTRWLGFVQYVQTELLPKYPAQLVKSTGDGLLLQLDDPRVLDSFTQRMHAHFALINTQLAPEQTMWLRIGCHLTDVFAAEQDIYGAGVNLACRIATLANPGETVVSVEVRDQLVDGLHADFTDLGECYFKHLEGAVRVFRLSSPDLALCFPTASAMDNKKGTAFQREASISDLRAVVAVLPFSPRKLVNDEQWAVGEIIAESLIGQFSRSLSLRVISHLSTKSLAKVAEQGDIETLQAQCKKLGVHHVLCGSYMVINKKVIVNWELFNSHDNQIIGADRVEGDVDHLLERSNEITHTIADMAHRAILQTEVKKSLHQPLPTLQSHSLLSSGINLLFRTSENDFQRSQRILNHLSERHNTSHQPYAWLAKSYVLMASQSTSTARHAATDRHADYCRFLTQRAIELAPNSSFSWAISGLVSYHILHDFDHASEFLDQAIAINPSESLAWLYKGMLHAFKAEVEPGLHAVKTACQLSPLDPNRHYFFTLTASAHLSAGHYAEAIEYANRAISGNIYHLSAHRVLVISQALSGDLDAAKINGKRLLQLAPEFTVSGYQNNFKNSNFKLGETFGRALSMAGIPM